MTPRPATEMLLPGCTASASWCQTRHIRAWADGGTTDIGAMTLLCGYHHHELWFDPPEPPPQPRNHVGLRAG